MNMRSLSWLCACVAAAGAALIPSTARAGSVACSSDGNECVGYEVEGATVQITGSGGGNFRNIRTYIDGNYGGQIKSNATFWTYNLLYGQTFEFEVQDCWSHWPFSSSCTEWAEFTVTVY